MLTINEAGAVFSKHGFSIDFPVPANTDTLQLSAMMADLFEAYAQREQSNLQLLSQILGVHTWPRSWPYGA